MDVCMSMRGDGPHKFGQGQVSGVGELALCLLLGLSDGIKENRKSIKFRVGPIVKRYKDWLNSNPSDIDPKLKAGLLQLSKSDDMVYVKK